MLTKHPSQAIVILQPPTIVPPALITKDVVVADPFVRQTVADELAFGNEELSSSWHAVAESPNGSVWFIRGRDLAAWTPAHRTVWIKIDHGRDNIIKEGISINLEVVDCPTKSSSTRLTSIYGSDGSQRGRYLRSAPDELLETTPSSPGRAVVDAFCPK